MLGLSGFVGNKAIREAAAEVRSWAWAATPSKTREGHAELSGKDGPVRGACKANATNGAATHLTHYKVAGVLHLKIEKTTARVVPQLSVQHQASITLSACRKGDA